MSLLASHLLRLQLHEQAVVADGDQHSSGVGEGKSGERQRYDDQQGRVGARGPDGPARAHRDGVGEEVAQETVDEDDGGDEFVEAVAPCTRRVHVRRVRPARVPGGAPGDVVSDDGP